MAGAREAGTQPEDQVRRRRAARARPEGPSPGSEGIRRDCPSTRHDTATEMWTERRLELDGAPLRILPSNPSYALPKPRAPHEPNSDS